MIKKSPPVIFVPFSFKIKIFYLQQILSVSPKQTRKGKEQGQVATQQEN